MPTEKEIRDRLTQEIARAAGLPLEQVDIREPFASYHIESVEAVHLVGQLERWFKVDLEPTLLWDYPTIAALARHLAELNAE